MSTNRLLNWFNRTNREATAANRSRPDLLTNLPPELIQYLMLQLSTEYDMLTLSATNKKARHVFRQIIIHFDKPVFDNKFMKHIADFINVQEKRHVLYKQLNPALKKEIEFMFISPMKYWFLTDYCERHALSLTVGASILSAILYQGTNYALGSPSSSLSMVVRMFVALLPTIATLAPVVYKPLYYMDEKHTNNQVNKLKKELDELPKLNQQSLLFAEKPVQAISQQSPTQYAANRY